MNVDELGYASYCHGVCNIVSPIATSPYYAYPSKERQAGREYDEDDLFGTYYHPANMNSPKINSLDRLPCSCGECVKYEFRSRIPVDHIPIFRRIHWLNNKNGEIEQFRQTPARLDKALRDKLANSMRTQLVAYIPDQPIFAVY